MFSTMWVLCGYALSSWKMKPEPTAAIPKGITAGYNEMVTQMHSQTRWSYTAIDLISVIFFAHPTLFKGLSQIVPGARTASKNCYLNYKIYLTVRAPGTICESPFKLICGSDMDMLRNDFCISFKTQYFTPY